MGPHTDLHAGDVLGRMRLVRPLGEGGLARVWLAEHEVLGSPHAVKLLALEGASHRARLVQEGRIQARLRHPHVLAVTDVVEHGPLIGLVMEYVDGPSLRQHLDEVGALPLDEALALFGQVLDGVMAAHDAGVLHRDLKPANVLLQPGPRGLVAKVADFGIAKVREPGARAMTRTGVMMGTPGYMAPEQINDAAHVDARADVFALGAMLYELLAGAGPFEGGDLASIIERTVRGRYTPLSHRVPGCPAAVAQVVDRCLRPEPEARPTSCAALLQALRGADPGPVAAPVLIERGPRAEPGPRPPDVAPRTWAATMEPEHDAGATAVPWSTRAGGTLVALSSDSPPRDATPAPLSEVRARVAARAQPAPAAAPRTRTLAALRAWLAARTTARTPATPADPGPRTEDYSRYRMLARPDADRSHYLRRARPEATGPTGDLLKRRPTWRSRAGLISAVAALSALATLVFGGTWLRGIARDITAAEADLRTSEALLIGGLEREETLVPSLIAQGADADSLHAARAGLAQAQDAAAAQAMLEVLDAQWRSLPTDPAAGVARAAIEARLQELHGLAQARIDARATRDRARALPGAELAVELGMVRASPLLAAQVLAATP